MSHDRTLRRGGTIVDAYLICAVDALLAEQRGDRESARRFGDAAAALSAAYPAAIEQAEVPPTTLNQKEITDHGS